VTAVLVICLVILAGRTESASSPVLDDPIDHQLKSAIAALNAESRDAAEADGLQIADQADDLTVLRRLSLALFGTIPSLEDIRRFQNDHGADRLDRWLTGMLDDRRYGEYFAERLARGLVGTDNGPFIIFRRDRLTDWLAGQIQADVSWADMTRRLIAAEGLWTDQPATNFVTSARIDGDRFDENRLAGRTVRMFLGQRIDCAQCHDHPFEPDWKQPDFEGLAAFFCQAAITPGGITDRKTDDKDRPVVYRVTDPGSDESESRIIEPAVPFNPEWLPAVGSHRERLAAWVTCPDNRRFQRAIANRVWGLMFGRPYHEPVDDIPDPPHPDQSDILDLIGREFQSRGFRISVIVRMIAGSDVFRRSSTSTAEQPQDYAMQQKAWAVFPLVRLRPEQIIGSLFQAAHIRTIDHASNLFVRLQKYGHENDFLREYGDLADDEMLQQAGTVPQALLRMNGRFTRELTRPEFLTAPGQILRLSPDDQTLLENCYLACLSRLPTPDEKHYFLQSLASIGDKHADGRRQTDTFENRRIFVQDLYWTLFNSPEFSWNH
jgi:hypothetical protein